MCARPVSPRGVDPGIAQALGEMGVATVHEAQGRTGLLAKQFRPLFVGARVAGPAITVRVEAGTAGLVVDAIATLEPGDVLVVAPAQPSSQCYFDGWLASLALTRGCAGVVVDGGVRNVVEIKRLGLPVWSTEICAAQGSCHVSGDIDVSLTSGATTVVPRDIIVADDDGICVVPQGGAAWVLAAAEARVANEADKRTRLAAGEASLDVFGLRQRLTDLGLRYV